MKFENTDQIRKWFRQFPLLKKELNAKIELYNGLISDMTRIIPVDKAAEWLDDSANKAVLDNINHYRAEIEVARKKLDNIMRDWERLQQLLNSTEILVITERYIKSKRWTALEFSTNYSRRQCFRIFNNALEKLVGQTVSDNGNLR